MPKVSYGHRFPLPHYFLSLFRKNQVNGAAALEGPMTYDSIWGIFVLISGREIKRLIQGRERWHCPKLIKRKQNNPKRKGLRTPRDQEPVPKKKQQGFER